MNNYISLAYTLLGFLLGSVMFSKLIILKHTNKDITKLSEDHNPGAFNAFKYGGISLGIRCVVCDILKGVIPILLYILTIKQKSIGWMILITLSPLLGHIIGIFNDFKGGKGIATLFGTFIGLAPFTYIPLVTLCILYLFFSLIYVIKPNRIKSIVVCVSFMLITLIIYIFFNKLPLYLISFFPVLFVCLKHTKYFAIVEENEKIMFGKAS